MSLIVYQAQDEIPLILDFNTFRGIVSRRFHLIEDCLLGKCCSSDGALWIEAFRRLSEEDQIQNRLMDSSIKLKYCGESRKQIPWIVTSVSFMYLVILRLLNSK